MWSMNPKAESLTNQRLPRWPSGQAFRVGVPEKKGARDFGVENFNRG